jgi:hypothetical protein
MTSQFFLPGNCKALRETRQQSSHTVKKYGIGNSANINVHTGTTRIRILVQCSRHTLAGTRGRQGTASPSLRMYVTTGTLIIGANHGDLRCYSTVISCKCGLLQGDILSASMGKCCAVLKSSALNSTCRIARSCSPAGSLSPEFCLAPWRYRARFFENFHFIVV